MENPLRDREYAQIVKELTKRYTGTFTQGEVNDVVDDSRAYFEARSKVHLYLPVFVQRFAKQRLGAMSLERGGNEKGLTHLLFVSDGDAGRSQMAAAFAAEFGEGRYLASSAGLRPQYDVLPSVEIAMRDREIPLFETFPKPVVRDITSAADVLVGLGPAEDDLPRARQVIAWDIPPVADLDAAGVRAARDDIEERVRDLLTDLEDDGSVTTRRRRRAVEIASGQSGGAPYRGRHRST